MRDLIRVLWFIFAIQFISPISLLLAFNETREKYDLVICALFKNEQFYIREWIEFHKLVGVQHFYLYDNQSSDQSLLILRPYIDTGLVEVFPWPQETCNQQEYLDLVQVPIYKHALKIAKRTAKWAAFIDLDEFLFPLNETDLPTLLNRYSSYGGLVVNWQVFGTSNRDNLNPGELLIEALVWKAPTDMENNHYIKSIVQPAKVKMIDNPHSFKYVNGYFAVNANGEPAIPGIGKHDSIIIDKVRINHYWFGTRNWFLNIRVPTKAKWGHIPDLSPKYLNELIALYNVEYDTDISRFILDLRKAIDQ